MTISANKPSATPARAGGLRTRIDERVGALVEARADQESRIRSLERTRWTWGGAVTVISILGAVLAKKLGWSFLPWLLWTSAVLALYPGSTRNGCQPE